MPAPSLGHLAWQRALDRPDLLAPRVVAALRLDTAGWAQDCYVAPVRRRLGVREIPFAAMDDAVAQVSAAG